MQPHEFSDREKSTLKQFLSQQLDDHDIAAVRASLSRASSTAGRSAEWMLADFLRPSGTEFDPRLEGEEFIDFMITYKGCEIFSVDAVRNAIYEKASPLQLDDLADFLDVPDRFDEGVLIEQLRKRKWRIGSSYARHFMRVFKLPEVFAGFESLPAPAEILEVPPFRPLPPLAEFQVPIRDRVLELLSNESGSRAMITLPTGAGKTRSVVEGLMSWRASQADDRPLILWIAQSEELCEQAVECFEEIWRDLGHRKEAVRNTLVINRFWERKKLHVAADVTVASIQKLQSTITAGSDNEDYQVLQDMRGRLRAVVVDEAHRSTSASYRNFFRFLNASESSATRTVILGLSATPYRADSKTTARLAGFYGNLIEPEIFEQDPIKWLRERRYLAIPDTRTIDNVSGTYELNENPKYRDYFEDFHDIHPELLTVIAGDAGRNKLIVDAVASLPTSSSVLLFACSVEHAIALSLMLLHTGISSTAITGATRPSTRRAAIERFRRKEIKVLTNYGVLTTGFDAPAIDTVIVARPTASSVLYEQMIGRGMRGPAFGGTERCLIIDVEDNLRFRGQMASRRHRDSWLNS